MKHWFLHISLLFTLICFGISCEDVEALSDAAEVEMFAVAHSSPSSIILGDPEINTAEALIRIPMLYGKYNFPLHLRLSVITSKDIDKVLGIDFAEDVIFDTTTDTKTFYVVAASGFTKKWTIQLVETQLLEQTQIERFEILSHTPAQALLGALASVKHTSSEVDIFMIDAGFPLSVVPRIQLSEFAHIDGYADGDAITFAEANAKLPLKVVAESGKEQTWHAKLVQCMDVHDLSTIPVPIRNRLDLPAEALHFDLSAGELKEFTTDFDTGLILIEAKGATFPVTVNAGSLPIDADAQIVGREADDTFTFNHYDDAVTFYIVDNVSTHYIQWTVKFAEWKNKDANIEAFTITESSPALISIESPVEINTLSATISMKITAGAGNFPLSITADVSVSNNATLKNGQTSPITHTFATIDDVLEITVVAENGSEKVWRVEIINADPNSDKRVDTDVLSFLAYEYSSQENALTGSKVVIDPEAVVNQADKTISIKIKNWKKYFPLKVKALIDLSTGATISTPGFGQEDELVFNTPTSTKSFTVTAENQLNTAVWTIQFIDEEPDKSSAANLVDFVIGANISSGNTIDKYFIEPSKRQITLLLLTTSLPGESLKINPTFTLSPRAYLLDIENSEEIAFTSLSHEKTFRIMAEDETTIQSWKIVLVFAPQLTNWNLDTWSDNKNAEGWSSANAALSSNPTTTRVSPGYGGTGYAAKMTSTTATMVIKIMASGSLFQGHFVFNLGYATRPKLMTWFGVPWGGKPIALEADYTYSRGSQRVKPSGLNFVNVNGDDYGSATIELLHWDGTGSFEYHAVTPDDGYSNYEIPSNITVTARAMNDHIAPTSSWQKLRLNLATLDSTKPSTHMHITFASSYEGDLQIGAPGSTLTIDNVRLIYYEPEAGAIVKQ
jgi:hypothetical protein